MFVNFGGKFFFRCQNESEIFFSFKFTLLKYELRIRMAANCYLNRLFCRVIFQMVNGLTVKQRLNSISNVNSTGTSATQLFDLWTPLSIWRLFYFQSFNNCSKKGEHFTVSFISDPFTPSRKSTARNNDDAHLYQLVVYWWKSHRGDDIIRNLRRVFFTITFSIFKFRLTSTCCDGFVGGRNIYEETNDYGSGCLKMKTTFDLDLKAYYITFTA